MTGLVLIASTKAEGRDWLAAQPAPPATVAIVTPRSPGAARGHTAGAVLVTPAGQQLAADVLQRLVDGAMPSVAAVRARRVTASTAQN